MVIVIALPLNHDCILLKNVSFNTKCLVWLTSNHMFGQVILGINDPENFEISEFQKCSRETYP